MTLATAAISRSSDVVSVTGVVLLAAVIHATWNAMLHTVRDRLVALLLIGGGGVICVAVVAPFVRLPSSASVPFLVASGVIHVGYTVVLIESYRLGDFAQAYPIARGTSPWVVTIFAAVFLGEALFPIQIAGIAVISLGLASLVLAGGRLTRAKLPAIGAAFATGLLIATYSLIDGVGVRRSGSPLGYAAWLTLIESVPVLAFGSIRLRGQLRARIGPNWRRGLLAGVLCFVAYAMVLWAQTRGALAAVAALRETSVIFGAAIGTIFFHERFGRMRVVATVLVVVGVLLLNSR